MTDPTFIPTFKVSPRVQRRIEEMERHHWLIENMLLMPRHELWIRRDVQISRAHSTTRIEGIGDDEPNVRHDTVRKAFAEASANALRAYDFVDYLSDLPEQPIDELVIRQLNREFLHGAAETLTPGVYRPGQNLVGNFTPPDQGDVPDLMKAFVQWMDDADVHPIIKAGIAHVHFVTIHPFWDGNGRTARALETLVLQRSRYAFKKLLSVESRLLEVRDQYFATLEQTQGRRFAAYDATAWTEFYTEVLATEVTALIGRLTQWHRELEALHVSGRDAGILDRHSDGIAFALQAGSMTRGDYIEVTRVSPITASRDLKHLVEIGLLTAEGKTSTRVYRPSPSLRSPSR